MRRKLEINDWLSGSLDLPILRTLSRRDLRGYAIVQIIQQSSEHEFLIEEGSLYPALQRLELNGWIEGAWGVTRNYRRARIYKLTPSGRKQLTARSLHTHNPHVEDSPVAGLRRVKSCLLFGCVVAGAAFGQQAKLASATLGAKN